MKTSINILRKNNILLASLSFAFILFMASCQKDDLPLNKNGEAKAIDYYRAMQPSDASADKFDLFASIKIDHISARTLLPDYSVTVKSDATVVFEGRRNCAVNKVFEFKASDLMMRKLLVIYNESKFYSIEDNLSLAADLPMVFTTCSDLELNASKTLFDYYGPDPAELIRFRIKIEEALDIVKYVKKDSGTVPVDKAQL